MLATTLGATNYLLLQDGALFRRVSEHMFNLLFERTATTGGLNVFWARVGSRK